MTRSSSDVRIRILVGSVLFVAVTACSLIVDSKAEQCSSTADCTKFSGTVCQAGFCVSSSSLVDGGGDLTDGSSSSSSGSVDGGDGGKVDSGCVPLTSTPAELANDTCTGADCVPFDNCVRLGVCGDAGLPALVVPPAGGVP